MEHRFTIGIDIGKQGAICIQEKNVENPFITLKMPMIKTELDYQALYKILEPYEGGNGRVVFERLGVIFGTSKATAFSMGHQAGAVEMACVALYIPFIKVPPKEWQKAMFTGVDEITKPSKTGATNVRDTKAMALVAMKRLFPTVKLTFGDSATKPDDGLIDAVLMSEYAKRL
jgi:hypothetical protein